MEKDSDKRFQSDVIGMDLISRQHPFNMWREKDINEEKQNKYPKTTAYKTPSLGFRILRRCFHAIFIMFGLMFILHILATIWR